MLPGISHGTQNGCRALNQVRKAPVTGSAAPGARVTGTHRNGLSLQRIAPSLPQPSEETEQETPPRQVGSGTPAPHGLREMASPWERTAWQPLAAAETHGSESRPELAFFNGKRKPFAPAGEDQPAVSRL